MPATPEQSFGSSGPAPAAGPPPPGAGYRPPAAEPQPPASRQSHRTGPGFIRLPVAATVTTLWAAVLSYVPVALVMALVQVDAAASVADTARLGLAAWLLGHGVPLGTGVGALDVPPLAVTLLVVWRVARAGMHTSRAVGARRRAPARDTAVAAGALAVTYGLLGALAATAVGAPGPTVSPLRAGATLAAFGAGAAVVGALPATGALAALASRTPAAVRDGLRTGVVAGCLLVAAGAGIAGLAIALKGGDAADLIAAYRTGTAGQAGITLVSVAFAPNVAVWAAAYALGPGFAVGTDTVVRTTDVTAGVLPALPLAAGLPEGPLDGLGAALLAVPVAAGLAAGWLLARRRSGAGRAGSRAAPPPGRVPAQRVAEDMPAVGGWTALLASATLAGPVAGLALGLAAVASGGSLGDGRLAQLGPTGWQVAAAATVLVGLGSVVGAATGRAVSGS
jgi:Family of unknown function (DUF6350)